MSTTYTDVVTALLPRRLLAVTAVLAVSVAGCGTYSGPGNPVVEKKLPAELAANVTDGAKDVTVDTLVGVTAEHGEVTEATLTSKDAKQKVTGTITDDGWQAGERLEPGTTYVLKVTADGEDGKPATLSATFRTQKLTLDEQTYPAVAPLQGEKVGVGMPVIVTFDRPVKDRAEFERHMTVTSEPAAGEGSWSWLSNHEVHYRPKTYWPAGAKVHVELDLNSVPAGDGIYGQQDQNIDFTIGRKAVSVVDMKKHKLTYSVDDKVKRTIPVSTGDAGHQSRNGTKIIMEKFASVDMDAASTGVDSSAPDYYNMKGVKWAMRVTNSGEFLHAAPWNAGYLGRANMSHGCTGMSTADAGWLYQRSRRGDIVKFVGGTRSLEDHNGWTDWNVPWDEWVKGSALPAETPTPTTPTPTQATPSSATA